MIYKSMVFKVLKKSMEILWLLSVDKVKLNVGFEIITFSYFTVYLESLLNCKMAVFCESPVI